MINLYIYIIFQLLVYKQYILNFYLFYFILILIHYFSILPKLKQDENINKTQYNILILLIYVLFIY